MGLQFAQRMLTGPCGQWLSQLLSDATTAQVFDVP